MVVEEVAGRIEEKAWEAIGRAKSEGFEDAALLLGVYERSMAKFFDSRISIVQSWLEIRLTIYLAREGRTYYASQTVSEPEAIPAAVAEAAKLARLMPKAELYAPLPQPTGKPLEGLWDRATVERMDSVAELADEVIQAATSVNPSAKAAGMVEIADGYRMVFTSAGARLAERRSKVNAYARVLVGEASGHWAYISTRLEEKALRGVGETAARYANEAASTPKVPLEPGEYTAILSPLVVGNLFGDLAVMASALHVLMGFSIFAKYKPGEKLGSERLTVLDDPHDTSLPNSTGFDDEGVATRRKPVIEKGVVKTLLHNTKTATMMKTETTGNAGLVMPTPWNIVVEPGDATLEEMVRETRRGLLVLNNWYTRFQNYVEGVFSTVTRDALLYIEDGEVKGSVSRLRIADTMPNLLRGVAMVGREQHQVAWWETPFPTKTPYILVEKLKFTRPEA